MDRFHIVILICTSGAIFLAKKEKKEGQPNDYFVKTNNMLEIVRSYLRILDSEDLIFDVDLLHFIFACREVRNISK